MVSIYLHSGSPVLQQIFPREVSRSCKLLWKLPDCWFYYSSCCPRLRWRDWLTTVFYLKFPFSPSWQSLARVPRNSHYLNHIFPQGERERELWTSFHYDSALVHWWGNPQECALWPTPFPSVPLMWLLRTQEVWESSFCELKMFSGPVDLWGLCFVYFLFLALPVSPQHFLWADLTFSSVPLPTAGMVLGPGAPLGHGHLFSGGGSKSHLGQMLQLSLAYQEFGLRVWARDSYGPKIIWGKSGVLHPIFIYVYTRS